VSLYDPFIFFDSLFHQGHASMNNAHGKKKVAGNQVSELVGLANWKNISEVGLLDGSEPLGSKLEWTWGPSGGGATDELAKQKYLWKL